jgi:hypothetical protein
MKVFLGQCEIALSKDDLARALRLWVKHVTFAQDGEFCIERFTLHPDAKYPIRMTVQPPTKVAQVKAIADAEKDGNKPTAQNN